MNIVVCWDDDAHTIVRYTFEPTWTWPEFFVAVQQAKALIDSVPGQVGVIMEGKAKNIQIPSNMLLHSRNALRQSHPRTVIVVIVMENSFLGVIVSMLTKISGASGEKLRTAGTLEEARQLVRARLAK